MHRSAKTLTQTPGSVARPLPGVFSVALSYHVSFNRTSR